MQSVNDEPSAAPLLGLHAAFAVAQVWSFIVMAPLAQAQKRLEAMAGADAVGGWRQKGMARTRWRRWTGSATGGGGAGRQWPSALVAVPTANVWSKTELLLHSLAGNSDSFELLVGFRTFCRFA